MGKTKKNIILQSIYQIATMIIPFITAPYISRVLGNDQVGIYSYTYSIVSYFMMFSLLGIEYYGNRTVAKVRGNQSDVNKVFTEVFVGHLFPAVTSLIIYIVFSFTLSGVYKLIAFIQTLYIIGEILNINWLFAGLGEFKITIVRNLFIKLLTIACIFIFVRNSDDLILYIAIMALGMFLSQTVVWVAFGKYAKFVRINIRDALSHLKPMSVLFIAVVATNIYRMIDKTMLGYLGNLGELGCYEYADKLLRMPLSVIVAIGSVMLSKTANMYHTELKEKSLILLTKTLKIVSILSFGLIFGMIIFGEDFSVLFLGEKFAQTGQYLEVLAISFLFMSWNSVLRTQYFMPQDLDKYYVISVWLGAIVNIILNVLLIQTYGAVGAAVATVIAYLCVFVAQLYFARKDIMVFSVLKDAIPGLIIGFISSFIVFVVKTNFRNNWMSLGLLGMLYCTLFVVFFIIYAKIFKDSDIGLLIKRRKR